ncbi:MAG: hypothetical protein IPM45_17690 [Acidimicrobiales bacterium]|nr:hypothetical protein [Acidimicrobiales bacterium]
MVTLRRAGGLLAALVLVTGCAFVSNPRTEPQPLVAGRPGRICFPVGYIGGIVPDYIVVNAGPLGVRNVDYSGATTPAACFDVNYPQPGTRTIDYTACAAAEYVGEDPEIDRDSPHHGLVHVHGAGPEPAAATRPRHR